MKTNQLLCIAVLLGTAMFIPSANAQVRSDAFAAAPALIGMNVRTNATDLTNYTAEANEPPVRDSGIATKSAWWKFTPATAGLVVISTLSDFASGGGDNPHASDTVLGVFTGATVNALTKIVFNDDIGAFDERNSRVMFVAAAGTTYFINASTFGANNPGFVKVEVRQPQPGSGKWTAAWQVPDPSGVNGTLGYYGTISFTTTERSAISGVLLNGKVKQTFTGFVSADGYFVVSMPAPNAPTAIPLTFILDLAPTAPGSVNLFVDYGEDLSLFSAHRAIVLAKGAVFPDAGYYTASMNEGGGTEYLTATVAKNGKLIAKGRGADGLKIAFTGVISGDPTATTRQVPFYQFVSGGRVLLGNLAFNQGNAKSELVSSSAFSARPANPAATFLPAGFASAASFSGAHYTPPTAGVRAGDLLTTQNGDRPPFHPIVHDAEERRAGVRRSAIRWTPLVLV